MIIFWPDLQTLLAETIPHYVFDQEEKFDPILLNVTLRISFPELYKGFLESYFFNIHFGGVCSGFFWAVTSEITPKKKGTVQFS